MSDIQKVTRTYLEALEDVKKLYEDAKKKMTEAFEPLFVQFLNENPDVQAIGWTQYTPYFNDGDECTFRVNDFGFLRRTDEQIEQDYRDEKGLDLDAPVDFDDIDLEHMYGDVYDWNYVGVEGYKYRDSWSDSITTMNKLLREFDEDIFKHAFGDHAKVIVTRNGITVEEYEHD